MRKAKISPKRKSFSPEQMPIVGLKKAGVEYSPTAKLRDKDFTAQAIGEALLDGDHEAVKEIIRNHFEAINAAKALKEANMSKRTFYEAVSEKGNPRLNTLAQIMHAMKAAS